MMSWGFPGLGALQVIHNCGLLKGDPGCFISAFNCNYTCIMKRFRYKWICLLTGNDVMAFSIEQTAAVEFYLRILKGRPRFISVFICMYTSIVHRFWYIQVDLASCNDVMAFSSIRSLQMIHNCGFWKDYPDYISLFIDIGHRPA